MFEKYADLRDRVIGAMGQSAAFGEEYGTTAFRRAAMTKTNQLEEQHFSIAVIGHMKRGKSTFLNAILGRKDDNISPVGCLPCTAAIVRYLDVRHHPEKKECAVVHFNESTSPEVVSLERVREYVTQRDNPDNTKDVKCVDIYSDFELLHGAACLVDTPGRGAIHKHHALLLDEYLPRANALLFLVCADLPIEKQEREFLDKLVERGETRKMFFVLTKVDEMRTDADLKEVTQYVRRHINEVVLPCDRLYQVSAQQVFELRRGKIATNQMSPYNEMELLIEDLERFILKEASEEGTLKKFIQEGVTLAQESLDYAGRMISDQLQLYDRSWSDIEVQIKDLQADKQRIQAESRKAMQKFRKAWTKSVDKFRDDLENKSMDIEDRVLPIVERASTWGLLEAASKVPREIQRVTRPLLGDLAADLKDELEGAVQELYSDTERTFDIGAHPRVRGQGEASNLAAMAGILGAGSGLGTLTAGGGLALGGGAIYSAIQGLITYKTSVATAGAWAKILAWWYGAPVIYTGGGALAASLAALPGAIMTLGGGLLAGLLVYKLTAGAGRRVLESKAKKSISGAVQ
jgi:GTP-binding protein EngB required for normal cell division